jgi:glycosyltransferase involved in cell wall biosynthesis
VGHRSPRKGFQRVLRAMPALVRDFPDLGFAIVGGPGGEADNGPELERQARALGLEGRVVMAGPRPPDEVVLWLNAADVFVLASDLEGCPNVVWEAMACGRPVVASRVGHVEYMVPDHAGIVFGDPDDGSALENALRAALRRCWDAEAIRESAARQTWEGVSQRVLAVWHRVLGQH